MNQEDLFGKAISELCAQDLEILKSTAEGWFFEYKREIVQSHKIAKSISSFANSYGGWLFYGISATKNERCAAELCGIKQEEIGQAEITIRQAVSTGMSPAAYFDHKVILGPWEQFGLKEGYAVIAVFVPQGNNAPYVHSSGRIYRRVGDESEPREETDRHFLDLLWNRNREIKDELRLLIQEEPPRQRLNERIPVVRLLIFHDVWRMRRRSCAFVDEEYYDLMKSGSLIFDNVYPTHLGYIARQCRFNDPLGMLFSWHHRRGCVEEITIPLNTYRLDDTKRLSNLKPYSHAAKFIEICRSAGAYDARVVDLSIVYRLLVGICLRLNDILLKEDVKSEVKFKLQIGGMSGCVPFLDVPELIRAIEANGIPVAQDQLIYSPPGFAPETLQALCNAANPQEGSPETDVSYCAIMNCISIFIALCTAVGIDVRSTGFDWTESGVLKWHDALDGASSRSHDVSASVRVRSDGHAEI